MKKTRKMNVIMLALVAALVMTTLTIALVACNKDEQKSNDTSSVAGTYYLYENGEKDSASYVILNNDGTWTDGSDSGSFSLNGTAITLYLNGEAYVSGAVENGVLSLDLGFGVNLYMTDSAAESLGPHQPEGGDDTPKSKYLITFRVNGGDSLIASQFFTEGELLSNLPYPTRHGYNFVSYSGDDGKTYTRASVMPAYNLVLTAEWSKTASTYKDDYVTFSPANSGKKHESDWYLDYNYGGLIDQYIFVELTSDDLGGISYVGERYNFDLTRHVEMEFNVADGYTLNWYDGNFSNPNGAQVFSLNYGSNLQLLTVSEGQRVVKRYVVDFYVLHDYTVRIYKGIYENSYTSINVYESYVIPGDAMLQVEDYEFEKYVYFNSDTGRYEAFDSSQLIWKDWNIYQTYKPKTVTFDLDEGTIEDDETTFEITPFSKDVDLPTPTKDRYDFVGWQYTERPHNNEEGEDIMFTTQDGNSGVNFLGTGNNYFSGLKAIWEEKDYALVRDFETVKLSPAELVVNYSDEAKRKISGYSHITGTQTFELFDENTYSVGDAVTITEFERAVGAKNWLGWYIDGAKVSDGDSKSYTFDLAHDSPDILAKWEMEEALDPFIYEYQNEGQNLLISGVREEHKADEELTIPDYVSGVKMNGLSGSSVLRLNMPLLQDDQDLTGCTTTISNWWHSSDEITLTTVTFTSGTKIARVLINLPELKDVYLPNTVTEATYNAFGSVTANIHWGDEPQIQQIGQAYYGYLGTSIVVPDSVTEMSSMAFANCVNLVEITLPFVGQYADKSKYVTDLSHWKAGLTEYDYKNALFGYMFSSTNPGNSYIEVNQSYKYNDVTYGYPSVQENTYTGHKACFIPKSLKKVTITKVIPPYAFTNCSFIEELTIGENVTSIGSNAFSDCKKLLHIRNLSGITLSSPAACDGEVLTTKDAEFQNKLERDANGFLTYTVGDTVYVLEYDGKSNVLDLSLNSSINAIYPYAFSGCTGLREITIPDSVTSIGNCAFSYCTGLQTVAIGSGVTSIGVDAFQDCTGLQVVTIGSGVTYIGNSAFYDCTGITRVNYLGDLKGWCEMEFGDVSANPLYISNYAKSGRAKLYVKENGEEKEVTGDLNIPDDMTKIGGYVFYGLTGITSVTIPESVTGIGDHAFYNCTGLRTVTIGNGTESIGNNAFSGCTSITTATIPAIAIASITKDNLNTVTITSGNIPYEAFRACTKLQTVMIGEGVENIGNYAFRNCTGLQTVTIESGNIGENTFYSCSGMQTVTIGEGVTSIGNNAFSYCTGITKVIVSSLKGWCEIEFGGSSANPLYYADNAKLYVKENGEDKEVTGELNILVGTTKIGNYAFYKFTGITSVTIPDSVTSIGDHAFEDCTGLRTVKIGNSVTSIGSDAFYDCTGLRTVTIGVDVTSIGMSAFYNCKGITKVVVSSLKGWCEIEFKNYPANPLYYGNAKLYVKENGEEKEVAGEVNISVGTTKIGIYAFYKLTGITSVTIPESVTSIGESAFYNCKSITRVNYLGDLKGWCEIEFSSSPLNGGNAKLYVKENGEEKEVAGEVNIPDGITKVGGYAFYGLTGITSVTIPDSVTSIGEYAFSGCTGLQTVTIGAGVKSIGNYAFRGCTGLQTVTIGSGVTRIGNYAFSGCTGLQTVTIGSGVTSIGSSAFYNCTGLKDIYYAGDETQWENITKGSYWDRYNSNGYDYTISYQMHYNSTGPEAAAVSSSEETGYEGQERIMEVRVPEAWMKQD